VNTELLMALSLFAFVSSVTPGPNNIMLMSSGATFGFVKTLPHMLGVGIGFTLMVVLIGAGIMTLFDVIPASYQVLKWVSIIYLLYLAYRIATSTTLQRNNTRAKPFTFIQAALFQWVNPKGWTMALTAISVYAPTRNMSAVAVVAIIYGLVNIPSISTWVLMGQGLQSWLANPMRLRIFNGSMAVLLVLSLYPTLY